MRLQIGTKIAQAENFIRSATAPAISAGVIAANVIEKATAMSASVPFTSLRPRASRLPMNASRPSPSPLLPSENATSTQTSGTMPRQ